MYVLVELFVKTQAYKILRGLSSVRTNVGEPDTKFPEGKGGSLVFRSREGSPEAKQGC